MRSVDDIHLWDSGAASGRVTVLCLHGIGSSSRAFRKQFEAFPPRARVVAWDAPGYGESPDPGETLGLKDYLTTIEQLVRRIGDGPVHLLGVSWGGVLACAFAARYPEAVRGLVLAGASPGSGVSDQQAASMRGRLRDLEEAGVPEFSRKRAPRLVSAEAPTQLVDELASIMSSAVRLPGYALAAEVMASTDLRPILGTVRAPTLVVCGDRDEVTGPAQSQVLAGGIPHAVMVTIRGPGHVANQEAPDTFNDWVLAFLDIADSQHGA